MNRIIEDFTQWPIAGSGTERICYQNPRDPDRCIKISQKSKSKQAKREIFYLQYLTKRNINFSHIPKFYGVIETDDLIGIESEFIRNPNSPSGSPTLKEYLSIELSKDEQNQFLKALSGLEESLIENNIIPSDLVLDNILVVTDNHNIIKIMLIDGFGCPTIFPIANFISYIGKRKIERKWKRFILDMLIPYFNEQQNTQLDYFD